MDRDWVGLTNRGKATYCVESKHAWLPSASQHSAKHISQDCEELKPSKRQQPVIVWECV